jgi:DNA (cytosine-5)-methyltransferase 1
MENAHTKLKQFDAFAGYGGFTIAGERCGTQTVGFSEVDKYANAVLKYHYPLITNFYDITKINWSKVPDFDLLTGGSPCQDLSIAGKRAGLEGSRSGLFYEYMRAVKEKKPKYFIWENVKGALSSNQGFDFGAVISEMAETGYSLWWQVLNAKDFGVPQNRERIFVVGFRDRPAPEVFFERCDDEAHTEQNSSQGNRILKSPIRSQGDKPMIKQLIGGSQGYRVYDTDGIATCQASQAGGVGAKTGLYAIRDLTIGETAPTLRSDGCGGVPSQRILTVPVLTPDRLEKRQNGRRFKEDGDPSFTLTSQDRHGLYDGAIIRRLTPTECERLMGLPDNWTKHGLGKDLNWQRPDTHDLSKAMYEKIEISDSQRYKLCGNGVVVNVVEEIIKNIILCPPCIPTN